MEEERITDRIVDFLEELGWTVLSFDYPETGLGVTLHPDDREPGTKNAGMIVPDVIAIQGNTLMIMENKPYFDESDADKLNKVRGGNYSDSLNQKFPSEDWEKVRVGLGVPSGRSIEKAQSCESKVDFLIAVSEDGGVETVGFTGGLTL